jgi:hypothetical protein
MRNIDSLSDDAVFRIQRSVVFGVDAAAVALDMASMDELDLDPVIRARLARIRHLEARVLAVLSARIIAPGQPGGSCETRRP